MLCNAFLYSLISFFSLSAATATTSITLRIPPSHVLPNPRSLPPNTHATLTSLGAAASAYLTPFDTFVFHNVSEGSYLLDVHSTTHAFVPLRVDVLSAVSGAESRQQQTGSTEGNDQVRLKVSAWETYRGNDWANKGEAMTRENGIVEVRAAGAKAFYMERSSCECPLAHMLLRTSKDSETRIRVEVTLTSGIIVNVLSILKNPMILLGLVSMGIFIGMPYLVDNSKLILLPLPQCFPNG